MSKTYRIKPLVWSGRPDGARAIVGDGQYDVWVCADMWHWASPGAIAGTRVESESAAKLAAEQHWHDRIASALEEVGDE